MIRYSWTQPACENCWFDHYPNREPARLTLDHRETEVCVYCGIETWSGIYVRINPNEAAHPTLVKS